MIRQSTFLMAASLCLVAGALAIPQETIDDLTTAYRGETNANHRYTLFAQRADAEGYTQAALLFRATAQAEAIHRQLHRSAITSLRGNVAGFPLDEVKVGTTAENLEAAIRAESYERDSMYPRFLTQAKQDNATAAMRSLTLARVAEAQHARLFQEALNHLGTHAETDYYVCPTCGFTAATLPAKRCPNCRNGVEKFTKFSLTERPDSRFRTGQAYGVADPNPPSALGSHSFRRQSAKKLAIFEE